MIACGVEKKNIDVLEIGKKYAYDSFKLIPIKLYHNVPNCGFKLYFGEEKMLYATDTSTLDGISAIGYDLYMLEANYEEEEIQERIKAKKEQGVYAYECDVINNHLSKAHCDDFIYKNIKSNGKYIYLHQHKERGCRE